MGVLSKLKRAFQPTLSDNDANATSLFDIEWRNVHALATALSADESIKFEELKQFVSKRIEKHPAVATLYREFLQSLDEVAKSKYAAESFGNLTISQREQAVRKVVPSYVSVRNQPIWRQRTQLTAQNIELLLGSQQTKRVRHYIVRDLLSFYYQGKAGWKAVGYDLFPGHIPNQKVKVLSTHARGSRIRFELSDETYETLRNAADIVNDDDGQPSSLKIKAGQHSATFTKKASAQLTELLEDREQYLPFRTQTIVKSAGQRNFDCVIVGSGPVGAAAAKTLVQAGLNVLMLESGDRPTTNRFHLMADSLRNDTVPWQFDPWKYELHGDELNLNTFAVRKVGGSSLAWGAVTPRFMANDFRMQSEYGVGVDWPISYDDLEFDYFAAEQFMGVSGTADDPFNARRSSPFPMEALPMSETDMLVKSACDPLGIHIHSVPSARNSRAYLGRSKCVNYSICRACPIGAMYSSDQTIEDLEDQENFTLLTRAHVGKVEVDDKDRVKAVSYFDADKNKHRIETSRVILAAQAVENVRVLLLSSDDRYPNGLANRNGQLGKYLTEHVKFYFTGRVDQRLTPHQRGYETATTQQFQDHAERGEYASSRLLIRENAGPTPAEVALESGQWGAALRDEIQDTFGHYVTLGAFMEQLPYEDNRIDLSPTLTDEFGNPASRIRFELMRKYEERGFKEFSKIIKRIYRQLDATNVRLILPPSIGGHYMSCHRMGDDPKQSVTNANLESHEVKNLYLVGNGSFPTGGVSNPTLTSVALSIRMARRIVEQYRAGNKIDQVTPAEELVSA